MVLGWFVFFLVCACPSSLKGKPLASQNFHPAMHWKLELFVPLRLLSHPPVSSQCSQCLWDNQTDLMLENTYIPCLGIATHLVYSCTAISTQHSELCFLKTLFLENMEYLE